MAVVIRNLARPPVASRTRIIRWIDYRLPFVAQLEHELNEYPTPRNLNYWWNFGSLAGIMLVIMIVSGIVLAMHYTPNSDLAFDSVERIMRDVNYGWLIRYIHMNGASMFFLIVYIHIFRGLYYGSYKYPRELLWMLGVVILLLMMATAFMGYVLPWGQMSYWGATVITNLFSAIPVVGEKIVTLLWGGFTVGNPTLNRFFSLHYLLPFVIVAVVGLHLVALHQHGSNNPLGIDHRGPQDSIPFHPYYTIKDMFGLCVFLIFFAIFVFYMPNCARRPAELHSGQPAADPARHRAGMVLPAVLRDPALDDVQLPRHPSKLVGVLADVLVDPAAVRAALARHVAGAQRRASGRSTNGLLAAGDRRLIARAMSARIRRQGYDRRSIGQLATFYYFFHFLILIPLVGKLERPRPLPTSIGAACSAGGAPRGGERLRWRNRVLALLLAGAGAGAVGAAPVRRRRGGGAASAAPALVVRRRVRHLRPRRAATRLPGLQRGLLGLPCGEASATSATSRARLHRGPGQRLCRAIPGHRRPERPGRDVPAAGPAVRPDPGAVRQRQGGAGGE